MKKVLVLMSSYNGERFINEQIDSILSQEDINLRYQFLNVLNELNFKEISFRLSDSTLPIYNRIITDKVNTQVQERLKTKNIPEKGQGGKQSEIDLMRKAMGLTKK